jgi:hypothetical protein
MELMYRSVSENSLLRLFEGCQRVIVMLVGPSLLATGVKRDDDFAARCYGEKRGAIVRSD